MTHDNQQGREAARTAHIDRRGNGGVFGAYTFSGLIVVSHGIASAPFTRATNGFGLKASLREKDCLKLIEMGALPDATDDEKTSAAEANTALEKIRAYENEHPEEKQIEMRFRDGPGGFI